MLLYYFTLIDDESDKLLFEEIFNDYQKQMLAIAKGILKNREDAEDAVQNALLNIARHMKSVPKDSVQLLRAYLYTTTRNAAISLLRKKSREVETVPMEALPLASGCDPIDYLVDWDNYDNLLKVISQLPINQREIILLRYVQHMDVKEVAVALNRTPNYVRVQSFRAKVLLLQIYRKEGIDIAGTETVDTI